MLFDPTQSNAIKVQTLAQAISAGPWKMELPHDRPDHLLIWVTRGQGRALLNGDPCGFGSHNALFIPAHHLVSLSFGRQTIGQVLHIPGASSLTVPQYPQRIQVLDSRDQAELTALFEALNREQSLAAPLWQSAMEAQAELVGIWLRRHMKGENLAHERPTAAQKIVRAYFQRLVHSFASGMSMADHARELGVTPTHLTRVCKAQTGQTAAALLTGRLVHASRTLLEETKFPARDIARHLGFNSAAYFSRFVAQHCGCSPSALRNPNERR